MILFTQNLVIKYRYWIPKLLWQKVWLVNSVIVRDHYLPVGQESKNLMPREVPTPAPGEANEMSLLQ